jgi:hypothetical protein
MTKSKGSKPPKSRRRRQYRRLKGEITGQALVAALQASPHRDLNIEPKRGPMPVRGVRLSDE